MTMIKALLVGGPSEFPVEQRMQIIDSLDETIKFPFHSGCEQFRYAGTFERLIDEEFAIFGRSTRTVLAE